MESTKKKYVLIIHGGVGTIIKGNMTTEKEAAYLETLKISLFEGEKILRNKGTAINAIEAAISVMEDSPLFNAGKGAVLTANETIELDASFMNGSTLDAGAISGVSTVKNPISAAIKVMENSPHVMLSGRGAEAFAASQDLELVEPEYFFTEKMSTKTCVEKTIKNFHVLLFYSVRIYIIGGSLYDRDFKS